MADLTRRKFVNLLSFMLSLVIFWLTGATSSAKGSRLDLADPVETGTWKFNTPGRISPAGRVLPVEGVAGGERTSGTLESGSDSANTVVAYGGESPGARAGSGSEPINPNQYVPGKTGTNARLERVTLQRFLNTRARITSVSKRCATKIQRGEEPLRCIENVLREFEARLEREAGRGSGVAKSALPIVRQMVRDVREAKSGKAGLAIVRRGIGKVQRIRLVRSQDAVVAKLQQQQRAVLVETLQAVEINLVKAIAI
ncbi:hypothetical protein [Labrenzia sp. 011]|uniref:hypothetical protein n=1 Tax=Labrenzia sp. 011 TaxID=2171494 RepID=UPI000D50CE57|nr:hypothetical protein [Labrenzia sp. 011]PVB59418.1 hypothetical protein DCO57_22495 [Labrenzia sp. 011]